MAQTTVNIRMDENLKKDFEYVCDELGISMSTAVIIYAKKMSREHRIPFEVSADPFFNENNVAIIREGIRQLAEGLTVSKTIDELEALADG